MKDLLSFSLGSALLGLVVGVAIGLNVANSDRREDRCAAMFSMAETARDSLAVIVADNVCAARLR